MSYQEEGKLESDNRAHDATHYNRLIFACNHNFRDPPVHISVYHDFNFLRIDKTRAKKERRMDSFILCTLDCSIFTVNSSILDIFIY